ncbi:hypothetical protein ACFVJK_30755 [Streptomyces sp. NPDC127172]|uniref:hypothetical protein n=1 Tax=Streptomyces sp. NPDC127172 TaxID=3345382 RepID=UPI0036356947
MDQSPQQPPHSDEAAAARRDRYAAAIRPVMLLGLQDAMLDGPGGTERINDWVDWIAKTLADLDAQPDSP